MIPREHGAYAQLLFPLATALALGRPNATALSIAGAAVLLFLAHEWALTLVGKRHVMKGVARFKHTLAGEVVAAVALASLAWPVALAAGTSAFAATACALAFGAAFAVGTLCVHSVIAATRKPPAVAPRAVAFIASVAVWAALTWSARAGAISVAVAWAVGPTCLACCVLAAWPPSARRLRVVGWTLVATAGLAALVLVAVLG